MGVKFSGSVKVPAGAGGFKSKALGGDPNFSSVQLLVHMDGPDDSTSFTDSSSAGRTITTQGTAKVATEQSKFGGGSLDLSGARSPSNALLVTDMTNAQIGSDDLTIEAWVYPTAINVINGIFSIGTDTANYLDFWIGTFKGLAVQYTVGGSIVWDVFDAGKPNPSTGTWSHVAWTRESGFNRVFLNGSLIASESNPGSINNFSNMRIGRGNVVSDSNGAYTGYIDEVRYTLGVARYTAPFSVPTEAFPNF